MNQIDHDPNEPKIDRTKGPWLMMWIIIAVAWAGYIYSFAFNWPSIALGLMTGAGVAMWACDVTGNKVPDSWKSHSSSTGGTGPDKGRGNS